MAQPEPSPRIFGLTLAAVLCARGLWPWLQGRSPNPWLLGAAALLLVAALAAPSALAPLSRLGGRAAVALTRAVSFAALAVGFFCAVTPAAVLARLFRRDRLWLRFDREVPTYWVERPPPPPARESMGRQF